MHGHQHNTAEANGCAPYAHNTPQEKKKRTTTRTAEHHPHQLRKRNPLGKITPSSETRKVNGVQEGFAN
eukprot:1158121-Pelagomonas_calceolata.AAC.2